MTRKEVQEAIKDWGRFRAVVRSRSSETARYGIGIYRSSPRRGLYTEWYGLGASWEQALERAKTYRTAL